MTADKPFEIVIATRNRHKVQEIAAVLGHMPVKLLAAADFPDAPEVVEDSETLEGNAVKKAVAVARALRRWAIADDTGLEVDYLDGAPGVYSARYAGEGCSYADNNKKLLTALKAVPLKKRTARFRCVIALSSPKGNVSTVDGQLEGYIGTRASGKNGFGYDPIFVVGGTRKTLADLSEAEKNKISHRGKALKKAKKLIDALHWENIFGREVA